MNSVQDSLRDTKREVAPFVSRTGVRTQTGHGSLLNIPDGPAWACLLSLVHENIGHFGSQDKALLLGLIEDWSRGVSLWQPYPDGADSAAAIAHWLLLGFDNYHSDKPRKRTLKVIAKIPKADAVRFKSLLENGDDETRDRIGDDFREMIIADTEGVAAARDLPNLVVSVATEYLLYSLDRVLRKDGDSAFWRICTRAGRPEDENLEAGSSGSESCAGLDLSHFAHVPSYRLLGCCGSLRDFRGTKYLLSTRALLRSHPGIFLPPAAYEGGFGGILPNEYRTGTPFVR